MLTFKFSLNLPKYFLLFVGVKGLVGDIGPLGRQGLDGNKGIMQRQFSNTKF